MNSGNDVYHKLSHSRILHVALTMYISVLCVFRITDEFPQRVLILVVCDAVSLVHWCRSARLLPSAHPKMKELLTY